MCVFFWWRMIGRYLWLVAYALLLTLSAGLFSVVSNDCVRLSRSLRLPDDGLSRRLQMVGLHFSICRMIWVSF